MKCFNHPEVDAVATCKKCGKGLCHDCAAKYTPCMCDSCAQQEQREKQQRAEKKEEDQKQKYRDALVDTRSEFIKTALIGVLIGAIWVFYNWKKYGATWTAGDYVGQFIICIFIPYGWKFLTYLQSFIPLRIFGSFLFWIIYVGVKACLSVLIGIPAFIFQLVKTILTQRKINKLDQQ